MKKLPFIFYFFLFIFATNSCSENDEGDAQDTPLEAQVLLNVSYGSHHQQVYDLYLPANRTENDTKVLFLIHGGGWTEGDKNDMNGTVTLLQSLYPEYAIVNVNYVLANLEQYAFPNQFLDVQTIVNKITSEHQELHIKPEFGMIGVSAGAHIAMMYDYQYDVQDQVKFVADIVGPSDFNDPFYDENFDIPTLIQILADPDFYPNGTDILTELSPVSHVSTASSPTCMFYGNEDPLVPESNGTSLESKLNQFGVENTLRIYQGGHGDNWSFEDLTEMQEIIGDYILSYL